MWEKSSNVTSYGQQIKHHNTLRSNNYAFDATNG